VGKKARDIMEKDVEFVSADDTVEAAAKKMASTDVGALPICNDDRRLQGMITDRDIAVKVVAKGKDPKATKVSELGDQPEVVTIGADDSIDEALRTMKDKKVRRLPVIDGREVVGIITQGDVAVNLPEDKVGELVEAISAAP
jgi:CBS domain-containing protein